MLPIKEIRIAVQVQDAAGNPLSGYRFAVADPKVGNLTGYRKINAGGSVFSLRPRSESVILTSGSAASGAVFSSLSTVHGSEFDTTPSPPFLPTSHRMRH